MEYPLHVLLIEDDTADALQVRRCLKHPADHGPFQLDHVATLEAGLDRLGKEDVDCVLLDLHLPDSQGLGSLARLREADPEVPVVVFTTAGDQETALGALQRGAQDYLVKDSLADGSLLQRSIHYASARQRIGREGRRLQEQLLRTEKVASLGVFSAGFALAFDGLLGTILDKADQLLAEPEHADSDRRHLVAIRQQALRGAQMAEQLRDFAMANQASSAGPIDLSKLVLETSAFVESIAGQDIEVSFDLSGEPTPAGVSSLHLHQLLVALVTNAVEAIRDGRGSIAIATGILFADRELLEAAHGSEGLEPGRYVFLRVSDTGGGMDAATRALVFDPFYTTKRTGRGLGLSAVLGIVQEHRGAVHVESRPGEGAIFSILLPAAPQDAATA